MLHRPHWSYSAITQYLSCPLRYYFQRILRLPQATISSSLVFGSAVHSALATYHHALKVGEDLHRKYIHLALTSTWSDENQQVPVQFKDGETKEDLINQGIHLVDLYLDREPPRGIVAVEQEIICPVFNSRGEYLEAPLVAIADLITRDGERVLVQEFKTAAKAYSEKDVAASLQASCYVQAVREMRGYHASIEYTVFIKTKTPKIQTLTTSRTVEDLARLGDIIEQVDQAVQLGIFYPVESTMNCSTCPYRQPCREWGREIPYADASSLRKADGSYS